MTTDNDSPFCIKTAGMLLKALRDELNRFSGDVPLRICLDGDKVCDVVDVSVTDDNHIQVLIQEEK